MKKNLMYLIIVSVVFTSFGTTACSPRVVAVKPTPRKKVVVVKKRPVTRKVVVVKRH